MFVYGLEVEGARAHAPTINIRPKEEYNFLFRIKNFLSSKQSGKSAQFLSNTLHWNLDNFFFLDGETKTSSVLSQAHICCFEVRGASMHIIWCAFLHNLDVFCFVNLGLRLLMKFSLVFFIRWVCILVDFGTFYYGRLPWAMLYCPVEWKHIRMKSVLRSALAVVVNWMEPLNDKDELERVEYT